MTTRLHKILNELERTAHATDTGRHMHAKLQNIVIGATPRGDAELIKKIQSHPELAEFFGADSKTEVPIAGYIDGRFASRRIDRLSINHAAKTLRILDYKTDINRDVMHDKYVRQLGEYVRLLGEIYPDFSVGAYILWTHDWQLEKIA